MTCSDPFDTIKVRLQTSFASYDSSRKSSSKSTTSGGLKSLFKGMSPPLATAAICNALIFATYGHSSRLWDEYVEEKFSQKHEGDLINDHTKQQQEIHEVRAEENTTGQNYLKVFTCGALAGTVQALVICPVEHIKCRLQTQATLAGNKQIYKGPIDACSSIIKKYGIFLGLYRGLGVTFWREVPAFGMYFAVYDTIKDRVESILEEKDKDHPIPSHAHAWTASALGELLLSSLHKQNPRTNV